MKGLAVITAEKEGDQIYGLWREGSGESKCLLYVRNAKGYLLSERLGKNKFIIKQRMRKKFLCWGVSFYVGAPSEKEIMKVEGERTKEE